MKKHMQPLMDLSSAELAKKVKELSQEISDLRRGIMTGEVVNNQLVGSKKRELARVLTVAATKPVEEVKKPLKAEKKERS